MSKLLRIVAAICCLAPTLLAAKPLMGAQDLMSRLGEKEVVLLDIQDARSFQQHHIPGSVNAPYSAWRTDGKGGTPDSMLPAVEKLEQMLGALGISPDSQVIIIATGRGAGDLAAAARVYWTLKVIGHKHASVLDGGLVGYANAKGPLAKGPSSAKATTIYRATVNKELLLDTDAAATMAERGTLFVDARSEGEYLGIYGAGEKSRSGTIPGSQNLPYDWIAKDGSSEMRDPAELKALFEARDLDPKDPQIHFCASGNRAALTWFASYALFGNEDAKLYDGSMEQWGPRKDLPIEQKIKLCASC